MKCMCSFCRSTASNEQYPYKYMVLSENGLLLVQVLAKCALIKPNLTYLWEDEAPLSIEWVPQPGAPACGRSLQLEARGWPRKQRRSYREFAYCAKRLHAKISALQPELVTQSAVRIANLPSQAPGGQGWGVWAGGISAGSRYPNRASQEELP